MSLVTMLPALITAQLPLRTPERITAFETIQTGSSMITGFDCGNSVCITASVLAVVHYECIVPE
jgi:hypothetical protein